MQLFELCLAEMTGTEYNIFSKRAIEQFQTAGILLILTSHVGDQTAYRPDRAEMVSPQIFMDTFRAILKSYQDQKLGKYLNMANKIPEAHVLFKYKFQTIDGKFGVANMPCAIAKANPPFKHKFTVITFMVKDNYQNDNFPRDSVVFLQK